MSNLIEIKKRISSISSTIKVTKVMHMIATSKIAKTKQKMVAVDKYNEHADEILRLYLKNTKYKVDAEKYFENANKEGKTNSSTNKVLCVLFSSDKGTCGAINTNIFKEATNTIKEGKAKGEDVFVLPIGKKAVQFMQANCEKLGVSIFGDANNVICAEQCNPEDVANVVAKIISAYDNGEFARVSFVYHKYKNIITCIANEEQILPIKDVDASDNSEKKEQKTDDFINIDETDSTARSIIEFFVRTKLYNAYISNIASIFSSRMNAMDNATKNGQEIIDDLRIKYNKGRQAHITSELSDIVSGFEAIS